MCPIGMGLEEAKRAAKSVVEDSHDTQQSGIKQSLKQNVTNSMVPEGSAGGDSGAGGGRFQQRKTGSKKY